MVTYKNIKETETELAHVKVFFDNKEVGYIMEDYSVKKDNWVFTPNKSNISYFRENTLKEVKETLIKIYNGVPVNLKLHFGLTENDYVYNFK